MWAMELAVVLAVAASVPVAVWLGVKGVRWARRNRSDAALVATGLVPGGPELAEAPGMAPAPGQEAWLTAHLHALQSWLGDTVDQLNEPAPHGPGADGGHDGSWPSHQGGDGGPPDGSIGGD